ncbi:hypothetical protein [Streptomyces sp. 2P-4]|uniref:hypothetical protein n=1 Tax=Streptomyces sp. 2P-4 TaxID=2931974 RepID=UPI0025407814|nr:hypothetical protein [Streptomyces sp. 2P-4]
MKNFLFPAVLCAPVLVPCVILGAVALLVRRARDQRPTAGRTPGAATCALVAAIAAAVSFGAYSRGVMSGFYILDPDQMCAAQGVRGDRIVTRWTLPVSAQCVTRGGVGTELVPTWVNPVVVTGLVLFLLALLTGAASAVRQRLAPR